MARNVHDKKYLDALTSMRIVIDMDRYTMFGYNWIVAISFDDFLEDKISTITGCDHNAAHELKVEFESKPTEYFLGYADSPVEAMKMAVSKHDDYYFDVLKRGT